ncbi:hypothetical protein FPK30_06010 [Bifidobacterium apousia]|uniref:Uncharacterized protein n=1 Tax=Bifidobacterium apousia TaxID=2750996 RepID=A0A556R1Y8_9BIFI|nr:hypothetical protein FPK30_06010 [Bifidobacterium apousia]
MLTCGLFRSYFSFAIVFCPPGRLVGCLHEPRTEHSLHITGLSGSLPLLPSAQSALQECNADL